MSFIMISDLMTYYPTLAALMVVNMIAVVSPGPDFAITVRNSLVYSRRTGLYTAIGISLGLLIHVTYSLLGLGFILKENAWLFMGLKYGGAGYLFYIGLKGILAKKTAVSLDDSQMKKDITPLSALTTGFLTNALNPKCMLFFISLFSTLISPTMPQSILFLCGAITFVETLLWFTFVALCLSSKKLRDIFQSWTHWIERTTGGLLMALGAKLLFTV